MKIYRGVTGKYHNHVTVQEDDGPERKLKHIVKHSPDGFSWGYGGSGPSELARCILLDHMGLHEGEDTTQVDHIYHAFKDAFVATWPRDREWTITSFQINEWAQRIVQHV